MSGQTCSQFKKTCGVKNCSSMLDVVVLWVNGSDVSMKRQISVARNGSRNDFGNGKNRFRDLGQFRYSLRSIEANLGLARRIFIVTNGQVPSWLDSKHPQIRIVDHSQLGLFGVYNSMAIQSVVHKIPTLSSPYLYSEDDIYFGSGMDDEVLFDGKAKIYVSQSVSVAGKDDYSKAVLKSMDLVQSIGVDVSSLKEAGRVLYNSHVSMMMYVEEMQTIWNMFPEVMEKMVNHAFRDHSDPHLPSLYTFMQLGESKTRLLKEKRMGFFYFTDGTYKQTLDLMQIFRSVPIICINDDFNTDPSAAILDDIEKVYKDLFPRKSKFEL
jgi:Stealth protein CR2, conserved region 2